MKHDDSYFTLNVIIPTYKRNHYLFNCLSSIIASFLSSPEKNRVNISIFDNDPQNNIEDEIKKLPELNGLAIHYIKRKENIGGRKTVVRSLLEAHKLHPSDAYVYVSDDDIVLPQFVSKYCHEFRNGNDATISSCFIKDDGPSNKTKIHSYRIDPVRPCCPENNKVQFIIASGLLTGRGYTKAVLDKILQVDAATMLFIEDLWYPMMFFASLSKKPSFIPEITFIHTINNDLHWDHHDPYQAFFIQRIDMYHKFRNLNVISKNEFTTLVNDFIGHQSLYRISRLFITRPYYLKHCLNIGFIYLYKNLLINKLPRYLCGFGNRVRSFTRNFYYI